MSAAADRASAAGAARARRVLALAAALGAGGLAAPAGMPAQQAGPSGAAAAVLVPDTVRVGEPATLGISVRSGAEPAFPPVLALPEEVEQLGPPRVGRTEDGAWRAVYRLAGWRAGSLTVPPVTVEREDGPALRVAPPVLVVESVLPGEDEPAALRPPRAPAAGGGISWALLLAALLLVGLAAWLLHRRLRSRPAAPPAAVAAARDPLEEARAGVAELRSAAAADGIGPAAFYDGLEALLRRYLARSRGRPPGLPMRGLVDDPRTAAAETPTDLARLGARSLPARFGALALRREELIADADAVLAWLDSEEAA